MNTRDYQICKKLLSEMNIAQDILRGVTLSDFIGDERTARAVAMTLINIGELVKNLTPELRIAHPEVPWRAISGMRDVTAHRYQTLRKEDVYKTCVEDLPAFHNQLLAILSESDS